MRAYLVLIPLGFFAACASPSVEGPVDAGQLGDAAARHDIAGGAPDLSSTGDKADLAVLPTPPDLLVVPDLALPPGRLTGDPCAADKECASGHCKAVLLDQTSVCVSTCTSQNDCQMLLNSFCEATTAGSKTGYCIPRSAAHCAACVKDTDCGILSERCLVGPGDVAAACHVDCALAGAAACPPDYTCSAVADGNVMRQLCVPKTPSCLDAIGGFCERVGLPQSCSRMNMAGVCTGQRQCLQQSERFDKCSALAPQFKMTCADLDPAGCTEMFGPNATNTPTNCGACGNVCPGVGQVTADVTCVDPGKKTCGMTCKGENYDVNNDPKDGCEKMHENPPGHLQQTAQSLGAKTCDDGASRTTFTAHMISDARVHQNPSLDAFNGQVGASPDIWSVDASGGLFCVDDYSVTFTTTGGGNAPCYKLTFATTKKTDSVVVTGNNTATISGGSGSYSDNSKIYFTIEKTCNLPVQETVNYTVLFHL